ncbi:MAG: AMP-binding protein [Kiritimatiellia bacterium]
MTLLEQFKANRDARPDAAAFLVSAGDRSVPITWREFTRDIEVIAWIIRKFVPGAKIALLGVNSYEWMTVHAACLFSGAVVLPLEVNLSAAEIAERLAFTGARVLLHSAALAERAHEVKKLLPKLITGGFGTHLTDRAIAAARKVLDEGEPGIFDLPARDEDEVAMLSFTSGTTARPRGAELTIHGIRVFSDFWGKQLPLVPGRRTLMLLPLYHIFGISVTYAMLAHGVALGICPDYRRIYEAVERFHANFLFLVPALAELLAVKIAQHGRTAEEALGTPIDWIVVGGAPLPGRTFERLQALGIRPLTGYGLTETTALYAVDALDSPHPGSAGVCCHGFEGMEARVSPEGILQLRGPSVLRGYYKEPERTAAVLDADGWFTTGDYGRIDENGVVWITGRVSRTIVLSSGKKVAPEELEELLLSIPGIQEVVVSGDFETRELRAEIFASVSEESVRAQIAIVNRKLPLHKRIRHIVLRAEPFPRTPSGKIRVERAKPPAEASPSPAPVAAAPAVRASLPLVERLVEGARRGLSLQRWKWVVLILGALAGVLVFWNVIDHTVLGKVDMPSTGRRIIECVEEFIGEIFALLVLVAAIVVWRTGLFKVKKDREERR